MRTPVALVALVAASPLAWAQVECKDVNAPPADILSGVVRLPDARACYAESASALLFTDEIEGGLLTLDVGAGKAGVVLLGPDATEWTVRVAGAETFAIGDTRLVPGEPAIGARLTQGDRQTIGVSAPAGTPEAALLIADGAESTLLRTHTTSLVRGVGEPIEVRAEGVNGVVVEGELYAHAPDGSTIIRALDASGVASFVPSVAGDWSVRVRASVLDADGLRVRTTQDVLRVSPPTLAFDGAARLDVGADGRHTVAFPVRTLGRDARVIVAAEVWGLDPSGAEVPVCWIARVNTVSSEDTRAELGVGVDPAWIARARADARTLHLREVRVHDTAGAAVLAHEERMALAGAEGARPVDRVPLTAMRTGVSVEGAQSGGSRVTAGHVIMFSHGYCSGGNPFDVSDFSGDLATFIDTNQNRSHDEFALLIEERGRDVKSMGLVAHSQGGNAAAHLFTFYWSALDWAQGPRLIQTVGVPWQGTPLAGNVAVLGDIFGTGCGANTDLSTSGAPVWLSTIPTSTRQRVTYHTTAFEDRPFSFDFCQFASDLVLADPDDGVIENARGQLPGGNNGGFVEGWCHTEGMRDPAQCTDPSRNATMNQEAAR
ncbi:MAG: hypothetical protein AAGH64_00790 [Planctomycetota bacterium]